MDITYVHKSTRSLDLFDNRLAFLIDSIPGISTGIAAQMSNPNYNTNVIIAGLQSIVSSLQSIVASLTASSQKK